jgi:hypothetical protein
MRIPLDRLPQHQLSYNELQGEANYWKEQSQRLREENERLRRPPPPAMNMNDVMGRERDPMPLRHVRAGRPASPRQDPPRQQAPNPSAARVTIQPQMPFASGIQPQRHQQQVPLARGISPQRPQQHAPVVAQADHSTRIHNKLPPVTFVDQTGATVAISPAMQEAMKTVATRMITTITAISRSRPRMDNMQQVINGSIGITEALDLKGNGKGCLIDIIGHKGCTHPKEGTFTCKQCFNSRSLYIRVVNDKLVVVQVPPKAKPTEEEEDDEMLDFGGGDEDLISDWVHPEGGKSHRFRGVW